MSIIKHFALVTLSATLLSGCSPSEEQGFASAYQKLGTFSNLNSSQAFGGSAGEAIRGIFYSLTPPTGTAPSPTGYWLRSQNTDYYAPITRITYNGVAASNVTTSQGWLQVTASSRVQIVRGGAFDLQFQVGGAAPGTLRVSSSIDAQSYGKYVAKWLSDGADAWASFCPHTYPDADNVPQTITEYMIPVGGAKWLLNGTRVDDAASIQLSCTHDSIGGCITWGYAPWDSVGGTSLKSTHQACTRMKRADFCGTGDPATTLNLGSYMHTTIQIWDSLSIHTDTPQTPSTMEASWNENGTICFNQTEYRITDQIYVDHMQDQLMLCPKPTCNKTGGGLVASARPCVLVDQTTGNCVQN